MRTHLITYTLYAPEQNYSDLIKAIKRYRGWCRLMPATWQIRTSETPGQVRDKLKRHISSNDKLYVVDVTGQSWAAYNLANDAATWMKRAA